VGMINLTFILRYSKGRCYGNQLNFGALRRRRHRGPLLFALAFDNELDDRKAAFKRLNGNNGATSCINLVSLCPIISEITFLKCAIYAATQPQFDYRLSFSILAFQNGLKYRKFDFSKVIGNHFHIYRNFVRFGSVTPEFKT